MNFCDSTYHVLQEMEGVFPLFPLALFQFNESSWLSAELD